jgi:2-methylcitrate dehydratase
MYRDDTASAHEVRTGRAKRVAELSAARLFCYCATPRLRVIAGNPDMQSLTQRLVALTSAVSYATLGDSTVVAAKRAILDALGCGIAALGCEPAKIAARVQPKGRGEATVIGERGSGSLERAVLLNGILVRYLDMMDVYWDKDICHPAENVPLALACVEHARGSGKDLIEAVVAAYEAQLRLTHTLSLQDRGMHHVTAGGIVAPLVIGKVWRLDPQTIEHAVALGGSRQFTLHALSKGGLSMAKALAYPWSAMSSILATRLAQEGFTGPVHFLDWLADANAASAVDRSALEHDGTYLIERVSFKQYPVQFELQTPVEIGIRLHAEVKRAESPITSIRIQVPPAAMGRVADPAKFSPENRETADHSLPVCVAMALLDGKLGAEQFENDRWASTEVRALVQRMKVEPNSEYPGRFPRGRPADIAIEFENGKTISDFQDVPTGDAQRPLDDLALERKFMSNAAGKIGRARAREIVECVKRLEQIERIDELTTLLGAE